MTVNGDWVAEKFDRRAATYDRSASHRWQARQAVQFLAPAKGERVLDVATGTGLAARAALGLVGPGGSVVGTDVSGGMLRAARQAADGRRCWFVQADAAAAPFPAETFDAVSCVASVPYFPDLAGALREWRRVCRDRARVTLTVPSRGGITTGRVLRDAAAAEGIELADPGGPLADPVQRPEIAAAAGWAVRRVEEVVFEQPRGDPAAAFGWVDSGFAEPLRTAPTARRQRVQMRFEALYRAQTVEQDRVLLVGLAPSGT